MRNLFLLLLLSFFVFLYGCKEEEERPASYYSINGSRFDLSLGFIDDDGTNPEVTYRMYNILLKDDQDFPTSYIKFTFLSNSTSRLEEGTYSYRYFYKKGYFANMSLGYDIQYDSEGEEVSGVTMLSHNFGDVSGTINVKQENGDYKIEFNLSFYSENEDYTLEGIYWAPLIEDNYL